MHQYNQHTFSKERFRLLVLLDQLAEMEKIDSATWHCIDSKLQRASFYRETGGELLHDIHCELLELFTNTNTNPSAV